MRLAIIGTGHTASITLLQLLSLPGTEEIIVAGRSTDKAQAMLLDAASAYPQAALRASCGSVEDIKFCNVLLFCIGSLIPPGGTGKSVLKENAVILRDCLGNRVPERARLVLLGTPVDDLTAVLVSAGIADKKQILGFGGDLDTARLRYCLAKKTFPQEQTASALCIGEHGARTIPVYAPETDYADVAKVTRGFLKSIAAKAGPPRNLATGVWLSRLAQTLTQKTAQTHVVCSYMEEFGLCLTWPHVVSADGVLSALPVERGAQAEQALAALIAQKKNEQPNLQSLARELF